MRFRDYIDRKRKLKMKKRNVDDLYNPYQTYVTWKNVEPTYQAIVNQPAGGASAYREPSGFQGSGDTRDGS